MNINSIRRELNSFADNKKAKILRSFFKTGPGEYGEGDIFIGVTVPVIRKLARSADSLTLKDTLILLRSKIHEERLLALIILIRIFNSSDAKGKEKVYNAYLGNTRYINNWDLVDVTAKHIVGAYLADKDKGILYHLAGSDMLWERRIAILSTFHFIERDRFDEALHISGMLMDDEEDLIHKAVGWMLREVGNRNYGVEKKFLEKNFRRMPRTMLRYAIERFSPTERIYFLNKK